MKKTIVQVVALLMFVCYPALGSAQTWVDDKPLKAGTVSAENTPAPAPAAVVPAGPVFSKPAAWDSKGAGHKIADVLEQLSEEHGFLWVRDTNQTDAEAEETIKALNSEKNIKQLSKPLYQLITNLLRSVNLTGTFSGNTVTVSSANSAAAVESQPPPVPARLPATTAPRPTATPNKVTTQRREPTIEEMYNNPIPKVTVGIPTAYGPPRPLPGRVYGHLLPLSQTQAYAAGVARAYGGAYHPATGYLPGYGPQGLYGFDCSYVPDNRNCTHGSLRIDADFTGIFGEAELQRIDLYVDGRNYGPVSLYNRWPNKGAKIPVGERTVTFVQMSRTAGQASKVYETVVDIRSDYVMRGEPNKIRVDKVRLQNGPFRGNMPQITAPDVRPEEILLAPGRGGGN